MATVEATVILECTEEDLRRAIAERCGGDAECEQVVYEQFLAAFLASDDDTREALGPAL